MGKFIDANLSHTTVKPCRKRHYKDSVKSAPTKLIEVKTQHAKTFNIPSESRNPVQQVSASETKDLSVICVVRDDGQKVLQLASGQTDLFDEEELKSNYENFIKCNLLFTILDEVALEGLTGITIEAFWKRVQKTLNLRAVSNYCKLVAWKVLSTNQCIRFYELPEARPELNLNHSVYNDCVIDASQSSDGDIYKADIPAKDCTEWGTCSTLTTRKDITEKVRQLPYEKVLEYGNKLVMVADETIRRQALLDPNSDPNCEILPVDYCLLEKIGRGRELGEFTQGPSSLSTGFKLDAKSLHHYCKKLTSDRLICRQHCLVSINSQVKVGRVIHLRRFYKKKPSVYLEGINDLVNYLKNSPNYRAPYSVAKARFHPYVWHRMVKHSDFYKYISTEVTIPVDEVDQSFKNLESANLPRTGKVQMVILKDPYINIAACWNEQGTNDSSSSENEDDEDNDEESVSGNRGRRVYNKDFIRDLYEFILKKGGTSTAEICKAFDYDRFSLRTMIKRLHTRGAIQIKKFDIGRQTMNKYVAFTPYNVEDSASNSQPTGSGIGILQKIKERQQKGIESLPNERVYSSQELEIKRVDQLLSFDVHLNVSITYPIPQVSFNFEAYESKFTDHNMQSESILCKKSIPTKFCTNLNHLILEVRKYIQIPPLTQETSIKPLKEYSGECLSAKFRPDRFTKAVLLRVFMDDRNIIEPQILKFLEPKKDSTPVKRPLSKTSENLDSVTDTKFGWYMGSNPELMLTEREEQIDFTMEVYQSTSKRAPRKNISKYHPEEDISDRVLFRISTILKAVQQCAIWCKMPTVLKMILDRERESGYDRKIDSKTVHRLVGRLVNEGYLKIFLITTTSVGVKRNHIHICRSDLNFDDSKLQFALQQFKEETLCCRQVPIRKVVETKKEKAQPKRSPFVEADVLESINEIKKLTEEKPTIRLSQKYSKLYGYRPKFARLSLLHEMMFYLVFELKRDTKPLSRDQLNKLLKRNQIHLTEVELANLPLVYADEISWKTFIPPLPAHHGWTDGWCFLVDVLIRFPMVLLTRCYRVPFLCKELQELLQHPIKRYYLLRHVSPNIRMIVLHKRTFVHFIHKQITLLAYCGLVQFGPSSFHEKEKSFFYLNRRGSLWDTTSSARGFQTIEDKSYPSISFYFKTMEDVSKYWSTMNKLGTHTILTSHSLRKGPMIEAACASKPELRTAVIARTKENCKEFDTGKIPGDHKGACGLDSALRADYHRNWYYSSAKNQTIFMDSLNNIKLNERVKNEKPITFKLPKQQPTTKKLIKSKQKLTNKVKSVKIKLSKSGERRDYVDRAVIRRAGCLRYRPRWTKPEDNALILLKVASALITPDSEKQRINYGVLRDIMHIIVPRSKDKTTTSVINRIKYLMKSVPFLANIRGLFPILYKFPIIAEHFGPFHKFNTKKRILIDPRGKKDYTDTERQIAFIYLFHYIWTHRNEIETALQGKISKRYLCQNIIESFSGNIELYNPKTIIYNLPQDENDIVKGTLKDLIHSAVANRSEIKESSFQLLKIYQQFDEELLRKTLVEMKSLRMIQSKKEAGLWFFAYYRLSLPYVSQNTTFTFQTIEKGFECWLEFKNTPNQYDYSYQTMEDKLYGQLFALNEVLASVMDKATIQFNIPENHLILNPHVEDHSDVIDELAKRFWAKLRNEEKTEVANSTKMDDDDSEIEQETRLLSLKQIEEPEIINLDDDDVDEPQDIATIDNLKHWISDCIDSQRVRSPSPELLNSFEIKQESVDDSMEGIDRQTTKERDCRSLTIEEIKTEMLKPNDENGKRLVPYISDLTRLLYVNFEDIETDERVHYLMKKHFVQQYPTLEDISVDDQLTMLDAKLSKKIWNEIERDGIIKDPVSDISELFDEILSNGGNVSDINLVQEVLDFIETKQCLGAKGYELTDNFPLVQGMYSLQAVLTTLTKYNFIIRTGVWDVTFVHQKFRDPWLINTFKLVNPVKTAEAEEIENICVGPSYKIKPLPWTTVEGCLNKDMFKLWLSFVFSHCMENPKILMRSICDKFHFVKPVDLFYLIELLERIGCVQIRKLMLDDVDLFSDYITSSDDKATFLTKFDEIYVDTNCTSFLNLGSFLHSCCC